MLANTSNKTNWCTVNFFIFSKHTLCSTRHQRLKAYFMLYPSPKTQTRRERTAQRRIPMHLSKRLCKKAGIRVLRYVLSSNSSRPTREAERCHSLASMLTLQPNPAKSIAGREGKGTADPSIQHYWNISFVFPLCIKTTAFQMQKSKWDIQVVNTIYSALKMYTYSITKLSCHFCYNTLILQVRFCMKRLCTSVQCQNQPYCTDTLCHCS